MSTFRLNLSRPLLDFISESCYMLWENFICSTRSPSISAVLLVIYFIVGSINKVYTYVINHYCCYLALIYCWGLNGIINNELQPKRCTFMVTDETEPRAPTNCEAVKNALKEITVTCEEGHDGGMQQVRILTH